MDVVFVSFKFSACKLYVKYQNRNARTWSHC